jgi:phospholipase/lecithinase/hemolysin
MTTPFKPAGSAAKNDLFVFGDSLSDIGMIYRQTSKFFPPSPPYDNGRFSNGPVTVETLAKDLGLKLSLKTDFAIGGAYTGRRNTGDIGLLKFGGLLDQVDQFKAKATTLGADAQDLYLIWAGANDLLNLPLNATPTSVAKTIKTAVSNISTAVKALADAGAKNIVVVQTPSLGQVPEAVQTGKTTALTAVSQSFNAALKGAVNGLKTGLPNSNLILSNLFPLSEQIAQNPATYGFTNSTSPYLVNYTPANPSADASTFFFWDDVHPTTRAHSLFAGALENSIAGKIKTSVTRSSRANSDTLVGFSGNDKLNGRESSDMLVGGIEDRLSGGTEADRFVYRSANDGVDLIKDFTPQNDHIDLSQIFLRAGNQISYSQPDRFAAYVRLDQQQGGTLIKVDSNGDAIGGFKPLAFLQSVTASRLSAANFIV